MSTSERIPVIVAGANGRMGRQTVEAVLQQPDMQLIGALGASRGLGQDVGVLAGGEPCGVLLEDKIEPLLDALDGTPSVLIDFTLGDKMKDHVLKAREKGVACIIGTTAIPSSDRLEIEAVSVETPLLYAPNFALGAVLMMKFAKEASRYFRWAEIIEYHHEKKLDAPSGTARRTADMMRRARSDGFRMALESEEHVKGARGGNLGGVRVHSVRMPGLLAHQEVLLGNKGETLTIRHDSRSRECYMPGVLLAIRKIRHYSGVLEGLECLLDEG